MCVSWWGSRKFGWAKAGWASSWGPDPVTTAHTMRGTPGWPGSPRRLLLLVWMGLRNLLTACLGTWPDGVHAPGNS